MNNNRTTNRLSKYQTWQPWIIEYNRLTLAGHSNRRAAQLADASIKKSLDTIRAAFANAKNEE